MNKKEMRKKVNTTLTEITIEQHRDFSENIKKRLLREKSIKEAKTIALTISKYPEVDTLNIIEELWGLGKKVVVPKCDPSDRSMTFYAITSFEQLETVYMDLKEPIIELTQMVNRHEIDVIIVPGIVYDFRGFRIGYGGGYYDRYLKNYDGTLISLAFTVQLTHQVPKEAHDIPVDIIITEQDRIDCLRN